MKFWHKIFIGTLIIFILAFDIGVYYLVSYSYNYIRERETENSIRAQELLLSTISGRITNTEWFYPNTARNEEQLVAIIKPLADYYKLQGALLALWSDDHNLYDNISFVDSSLLNLEGLYDKNIKEQTIDGNRHVIVVSQLPDYPHLTFAYARDISRADDYRTNISRVFVFVNIVVLLFLGVSIYLMLKRMTRPITELTVTAAEIANGAYDKRVSISSRDELGVLAHSFNKMADSIDEKMSLITKGTEVKQQFIDDLSHEIRTPLTSLLGYSEYLQNAKSTEKERAIAIEHLHNMALRVKNLSDKLIDLTYSRDENIEWQSVNIPELFNELKSMMIPVLAPRDIRLITVLELEQIPGEKILLLSMLQNLVENAARASSNGADITVRVYNGGGFAEQSPQGELYYNESVEGYPIMEVSDAGCGMDPQDIKRIMEPFYRVDKSRSRRFGGVGLGLSIVSQIVSLHSAKIEIVSEPGEGTMFRIHFTTF